MFVIEVHMNLETFFIRTPSNLIPYAPIANLEKKKKKNVTMNLPLIYGKV